MIKFAIFKYDKLHGYFLKIRKDSSGFRENSKIRVIFKMIKKIELLLGSLESKC